MKSDRELRKLASAYAEKMAESIAHLPVVRLGSSVRVRPSAIDYLIEARESRGPRKKLKR